MDLLQDEMPEDTELERKEISLFFATNNTIDEMRGKGCQGNYPHCISSPQISAVPITM
jgi:hypothetical protein